MVNSSCQGGDNGTQTSYPRHAERRQSAQARPAYRPRARSRGEGGPLLAGRTHLRPRNAARQVQTSRHARSARPCRTGAHPSRAPIRPGSPSGPAIRRGSPSGAAIHPGSPSGAPILARPTIRSAGPSGSPIPARPTIRSADPARRPIRRAQPSGPAIRPDDPSGSPILARPTIRRILLARQPIRFGHPAPPSGAALRPA